MSIDSHAVEAFLAIYRFGSVSAAAEKLRRTQSAISQRLHQMEEELGAKLFNRGRGRTEVALTVAGESLLPLALRWELLLDELHSAPLTQQPVVSIGATPMIGYYLLAPVYEKLNEVSHCTTVRIISAQSIELYSKLERREIDLIYVSHSQRMAGVTVRPVVTEDYCIATNMSNLEGAKAVDIRKLDHRFQIYIDYGPEFLSWYTTMLGRGARYNVAINDIRSCTYFLKSERHWCIVPRSVARSFKASFGINFYKISNLSVERKIYQAFLEEMTPASVAGREIVDRLVSENISSGNREHKRSPRR